MRSRLAAVDPSLSEPLVRKLLKDTAANELDILVQHPLLLMAQVPT
jgi:hypothetical protein